MKIETSEPSQPGVAERAIDTATDVSRTLTEVSAALQAAVKAAMDVLGALKRDGSLDGVRQQLVSFEERQRIVKKPTWDALESKFQAASGKGVA